MTVKQTGVYAITANLMLTSASWTAGQHCSIGIFVKGTEQVVTFGDYPPTANAYCRVAAAKIVHLASGDTVHVALHHDRSANTNLHTDAYGYNQFSVVRLP